MEWSLDFCERMRNKEGAVKSKTDEMEGRITTGTANLYTSCLYYNGLKNCIALANAFGMKDKANIYKQRMLSMEKVIEDYFGADIEGQSASSGCRCHC